MSDGWAVERRRGPAAALHDRDLGPEVVRRLLVSEPEHPALVLGSTQPDSDADAIALEGAGVELARRRSGGGAVLLVPGQTVWLDVEIPRVDPLWDDDVGRAFHWVGRAWVGALAELGVPATVHLGGVRETTWSRLICFAGLGPGEVTVDGRKLVGISQRRTRAGARFQCVVHRRWDPGPLVGVLALSPEERAAARADLVEAGSGLDAAEADVVDAFSANLPA